MLMLNVKINDKTSDANPDLCLISIISPDPDPFQMWSGIRIPNRYNMIRLRIKYNKKQLPRKLQFCSGNQVYVVDLVLIFLNMKSSFINIE